MADPTDSSLKGATLPVSDPLVIDSALVDVVYHRSREDQGLSISEIDKTLSIVNIAPLPPSFIQF